MPGFDPEIGKLAQRVLINPRKIDYHTGVFATKVLCCLYSRALLEAILIVYTYIHWCCLQITPAKDGKPVTIELIDAKTKEPKDTLEVKLWIILIVFSLQNFCKKNQHPSLFPVIWHTSLFISWCPAEKIDTLKCVYIVRRKYFQSSSFCCHLLPMIVHYNL